MLINNTYQRAEEASISYFLHYLALVATLIFLLPVNGYAQPETVNIGVLAYDGKQRAIARWQPTANYLSEQIPTHSFRIKALSHEEFAHELNKNTLDFILTNPGHYVRLEAAYGATRITTFKANYDDQELTRFSSVIFSASDSDIEQLEDLPGHRFAAVNQDAFGGFQLAQKALLETGIDALDELEIIWLGFPHSDVVKAVLEGRADAGTVRTGVLEHMVSKQELELTQLNILAARDSSSFPLLHSVDLYPEWPFATLPDTAPDLARSVAIALLKMTPNDPAAQAANGRGWTIPLDYSSVHEVFRVLEIEPYTPADINIYQLGQRYWAWLLPAALVLTLTWAALLRFIRINRQHTATQAELVNHQAELENKVNIRTHELRALNEQLRSDIAARAQSERDLSAGCKTMQSLYRISLRDDLNHEQRLQSIIDLARQYLGTEYGLLSSIEGDEFQICKTSPAQKNLSAPLNATGALEALNENKLITTQHEAGWLHYLASPVYVDGNLRCLLEFCSSENSPQEIADLGNELKVQILKLISQWLGHELSLLDKLNRAREDYEKIKSRFTAISPREKEVLALLIKGESSKSAAKILNISAKTVELHRANLIRKTQAKSTADLVRLAVMLEEREYT